MTNEQIEVLQLLIEQLISFAIQNDSNPLPYCFNFLKQIQNNIIICKNNSYSYKDELRKYIVQDWKNAMHISCGLPEYYIYNDDFDTQKQLNDYFDKIIVRIDKTIKGL